MFTVWSDKCAACSINVWCAVYSVQCVVWSVQVQVEVQVQVQVQYVVYTVQCAVCSVLLRFKSSNRMSQNKILPWRLTFRKPIALCIVQRRFETICFQKTLNKKQHFNLTSFCITPPSECRISAKLTFLVIDMKSLYIHMSKVGDDHWFFLFKS